MEHVSNWLFRRSDTPSFFGNFMIFALVVAQSLDGVSTYIGVNIYGVDVERNPLVAWAMSVMGVGLGLVAVKLEGIFLGPILYWLGFYNLIVLLTIFYLAVAVLPWAHIFLTHN